MVGLGFLLIQLGKEVALHLGISMLVCQDVDKLLSCQWKTHWLEVLLLAEEVELKVKLAAVELLL